MLYAFKFDPIFEVVTMETFSFLNRPFFYKF